MNRLVALLVISAVILSAGICIAAESEHLSTGRKATMVDRNNDGKIDGVDIYDESGKVVERGYDSNDNMKVDRWETTDENTGLPIVVASDESFLLE
jgi:hypothetical protein